MTQRGGYREGAGRKPGSKNKITINVQAKIRELGCPITALHRLATKAEKAGDYATAGRLQGTLAEYYTPKLRAKEDEGKLQSPLERMNLTLEEIRALKEKLLSGALDGDSVLDQISTLH